MNAYLSFIEAKSKHNYGMGFDPIYMSDYLFDFQKHLVRWALQMGRCAIFADCGLGKTPIQLVWADNVVRLSNKPVLILTPLAVSYQTVREAEKFHVEARRSSKGEITSKIVVANYERLHYFNTNDFAGIVCDESSILKNYDGRTKAAITEFMRHVKYRLLCTATAAPNDYFELGTSSEALGYLGYQDMLTRFFKQETKKDYLGWGRSTYRFRGYAEQPFWKWVCSWARACRMPSDLGFENNGFILPPLHEHEHLIENSTPRHGMLFSIPARDLREQREERRVTLRERCEKSSELVEQHNGQSVLWCHLNKEGDTLERIIPDALQVCGSMPEEKKEERLLAFQSGELKTLITKPKIGCYGLNWQNCNNIICFPSHSWEQYYQAVRRCWRFGQNNPVNVHIVTTEGEHGVLKNLKRKATAADKMFDSLVHHMNHSMSIDKDIEFTEKEIMPSWL